MEVVQFQNNPALAIKSWVEVYVDKMYSWAMYKTNSKETAEDLVQEKFKIAFYSFNKRWWMLLKRFDFKFY